MPGFDLPEGNVRRILSWVHHLQAWWMLFVAAAILIAPRTRFGSSYQLITGFPHGQLILGVAYLIIGLVMVVAVQTGNVRAMGVSLVVAGLNNWGLGVLLVFGAFHGPTGVLGPIFAFYVGAHMLLQSMLLNAKAP